MKVIPTLDGSFKIHIVTRNINYDPSLFLEGTSCSYILSLGELKGVQCHLYRLSSSDPWDLKAFISIQGLTQDALDSLMNSTNSISLNTSNCLIGCYQPPKPDQLILKY